VGLGAGGGTLTKPFFERSDWLPQSVLRRISTERAEDSVAPGRCWPKCQALPAAGALGTAFTRRG
jgi:hypothetical protein